MTSARFVTDASLDQLGRRLRFLGYDVATHRGARLEELFELAAADGRTVLTTSARHPRRWEAVGAWRVPAADGEAAVRSVVAAFEPSSPPFTRCPACNLALQRRTRFEALGEVPGRVTRAGAPLTYCAGCGKWYWAGSHVARIRLWFERVLGRPVPGLPE